MESSVDFYDPINKKFHTVPIKGEPAVKAFIKTLKHFGMQQVIKLEK